MRRVLRVKRALLAAAACVSALVLAAPATAEQQLWSFHVSEADLVDNKADYRMGEFLREEFEIRDYDVKMTEALLKEKGSFTILGGRYTFWNGDEDETVDGTDKTFDLLPEEGAEAGDDLSFDPKNAKGEWISFWGTADGGLQGRTVRWSLLGKEGTETIPNWRTTQRQLETYVPYVELIRDGESVTGVRWRLVNPKAPSQPVPLPEISQVRVMVFDRSGKRVWDGDWKKFKENEAPSGEERFGPLAYSELYRVWVRYDTGEGGDYCCYVWKFYERTQSDAGVASWGGLSEKPVKLKAGETREVSLELKSGYYVWTVDTAQVGEASVLSAENNGSKDTQVKLTLKGLKPGKTTLSIGYNHDEGENRSDHRYNTIPVEVWVTDEQGNVPGGSSGSGGGSGGGCDTGFGVLALVLGAAFLLKRRA